MIVNDDIIKQYKGLVLSVAKRYTGHGLDLEDLLQEGYIGLLKAQDKYADNPDVKFSTYATYWIRSFIVRAIENTGRLIRIPSHINTLQPDKHIEYQDNNASLPNYDSLGIISKIKDIISNYRDFNMYMNHYVNDISYRDIAKQYSMSYQWVKNRLDSLQSIIKAKLLK